MTSEFERSGLKSKLSTLKYENNIDHYSCSTDGLTTDTDKLLVRPVHVSSACLGLTPACLKIDHFGKVFSNQRGLSAFPGMQVYPYSKYRMAHDVKRQIHIKHILRLPQTERLGRRNGCHDDFYFSQKYDTCGLHIDAFTCPPTAVWQLVVEKNCDSRLNHHLFHRTKQIAQSVQRLRFEAHPHVKIKYGFPRWSVSGS